MGLSSQEMMAIDARVGDRTDQASSEPTLSSPGRRLQASVQANLLARRRARNALRRHKAKTAHLERVKARGFTNDHAFDATHRIASNGTVKASGRAQPSAPDTYRRPIHASALTSSTAMNATPFLGWARGGNRTGAAVTAFIAKQRRWRKQNADPARLWKPCTSEYDVGDKRKEDCETWCRPQTKPAHCRYCKCRACNACHNGSAALPEWANGPHARCLRFGQCDECASMTHPQRSQLPAPKSLVPTPPAQIHT